MPRGKLPTLTTEQEQMILRKFDAGESAASIARSMGITRAHSYSVLRRHGLKPGDNYVQGPLPIVPLERFVSEYAEGVSLEKIARDTGFAPDTVRKHLLRAGVQLRGRNKFASDEEIRLYKEGLSSLDIAKKLGVSTTTVLRRLHLSGVEVRNSQIATREKHHNWKGGKIPSGKYIAVRVSTDDPMHSMTNAGGYVMEHRLVLARHLGRPLEDSETVHHINGDTHDNRVENLQLRNGQHGKHSHFQCLDCGSFNVKARKLA